MIKCSYFGYAATFPLQTFSPHMPSPALSLVPKAKKTQAERILERIDQPTCFDFKEEEVLRMGGGSAANGDKSDPIVFVGSAVPWIHGLVERFCLDRLPATYGEFQSFLDYCANLNCVIGEGVVPPEHSLTWAKGGGIPVWEKYSPKYKDAARLFAYKEYAKLLSYHKQIGAMTELGRDFTEF